MWVPKDYVALQHERPQWTITSAPQSPFYQTGATFYRSEVSSAHIEDGLSRTYLCGEKFMSPEHYEDVNGSDAVGMMGDNQSAWSGYEWDNQRCAWNPDGGRSTDDFQPRQDSVESGSPGIFAFGSAHPGSLNMAFCDGSVRGISYEVDSLVHRYNANRLDGMADQ